MKPEVYPLDGADLPSLQKAAAIELAAGGFGFLQGYIGGTEVRRTLFRRSLRHPHVLVALLDGQLAGLASYKHRHAGPMEPRIADFVRTYGATALVPWFAYRYANAKLRSRGLYVCSIDVLGAFQRRGVGSALIAALAQVGHRLSAGALELDVRTGNHGARDFYRALGFVPAVYPLCSVDRLNSATNFGFERLSLPLRTESPAPPPAGGPGE